MDQANEHVAFVGNTLGPLYLSDPALDAGAVGPLFEAFANLDTQAAAEEWPFAEADAVADVLEAMAVDARKAIEDEAFATELAWDYRRLFVGPGDKLAAPWGSVYTDKDRVLFGETTHALRAWKRAHGIATNIGNEPDDHMGYLLELIAWVAEREPALSRELLADHIMPWADGFLDCVDQSARTGFYRGLARLTRASLHGMARTFGLHEEAA